MFLELIPHAGWQNSKKEMTGASWEDETLKGIPSGCLHLQV